MKAAIESPSGFRAWFQTFGRIRLKAPKLNPSTNRLEFLVQPVVNYLQEQFCTLVEFCLANNLPIRAIILKPRQKGCSTISVGGLYWLIRRLGLEGMIIGGQYDQTSNLWEILKRYHDEDVYPWDHKGIVNLNKARYEDGGKIGQLTAKNQNAGRSGTYQVVIVTELGRWEEGLKSSPSAVLQGVQATVAPAPNTAIILESTAMGNSGVFFEQWQRAISLDEFMSRDWSRAKAVPFVQVFAPAFQFEDSHFDLLPEEIDAIYPTLTQDEKDRMANHRVSEGYIAWRRHTLDQDCRGNEVRLMHDFPDTPQEAFHASTPSYFSTVAISAMQRSAVTGRHGVLRCASNEPFSKLEPFHFEDREIHNSDVTVFENPVPGLRYVMSVDTMTGISQHEDGRERDHHCAIVLRDGYADPRRGWIPPKVVARTRAPQKEPQWDCQWRIPKLAEVVWGLHKFYGGCLVAPEANKDAGLIMKLYEEGCPLYERDRKTDMGGEVTDISWTGKLGFLTVGGKHENTRSAILAALEEAVWKWHLEGGGIDIPDIRTLKEMGVFITNPKGRQEAAPGEHDDSVMALAIAFHLRKLGTVYTVEAVNKAKPSDIALTENAGGRGRGKAMYS